MFTLGIFTTHIPYIALVVFYAFFWIIGVNKASSGELQLFESRISVESPTFEVLVEDDQHHFKNSKSLLEQQFLATNYNVAFAALQKLKHKCFHPEIQPVTNTGLTLFSRPPPFLS